MKERPKVLLRLYREDVLKLEGLLDRDLSIWLESIESGDER